MSQKFRRITYQSESCSWCYKIGVTVIAAKKSILRLCMNRCGYIASIPKELLTFAERIKYYDPKRHMRTVSCRK